MFEKCLCNWASMRTVWRSADQTHQSNKCRMQWEHSSLQVTTSKIRYTQAGGSVSQRSGSHCPALRVGVLKWMWLKLIHYHCIQWEEDVSKVWHRQKEECETQSVLSVRQKGDMWLCDTVYTTVCHHHIVIALLHYRRRALLVSLKECKHHPTISD